MHSVLVLGGTGYIGKAICASFRRAGWKVVALARKESAATTWLRQNEVNVVIGDAADPSTWSAQAESANAIIHAASDMSNHTLESTVVDALIKVKTAHPSKKVVLVGGAWIYGSWTSGPEHTEESDTSKAHPFLKGRVVNSARFAAAGGIVLHPTVVFGHSGQGSVSSSFIGSALKGETSVTLFGAPGYHWGIVHVEDVGEAFVAAVTKGHDGQTFIIAGGHEAVEDIAKAAYAAAGAPEPTINYVSPPPGFPEMLALDTRCSSHKATTELGWHPKRTSFVHEAPELVAALKASSA